MFVLLIELLIVLVCDVIGKVFIFLIENIIDNNFIIVELYDVW